VSGVGAIGSTAPVSLPPPAPAATTEGPSLLPASEPLSLGGIDDALSALYAALSHSQQAGDQTGEARVQEQGVEQRRAIADAQAALDQKAAAEHQGGIWHDIENVCMIVAKVAAAVVAVAATVVTAGAASPVLIAVALALTAGGMVVSETKCFGDKASGWIGFGMQLAGTVLTCGAGAGAAGGTMVSQVANGVKTGAGIAGGVASAAGGVAHVEGAQYTAAADSAAADIRQSQQQMDRMNRLVGWVIDSMKEEDTSHRQAEDSVRGAIETHDATALAAAPVPLKG